MKKNKDLTIEGTTISGTADAVIDLLDKASERITKGRGQEESESFANEPFFRDRDFITTAGKIKDGICHYSYRQTRGFNRGEEHTVKGALLIEDDLEEAVSRFAVHLAAIDDAFKLSGIEIDDIDRFNSHELTLNYNITGFEVKGDDDAETVVITGSKRVAGGRLDIKSYRIPVDRNSSYRWFAELRAVVGRALEEVALYREGKGSPIEVEEEEKPDPRQSKLPFGNDDSATEDDFEGARI